MPSATRPDLLALTPDDLAAMANRGLLKRAQKEVEQPDLTPQWTESEDNTIVAIWSDSITCTLPGGKTLKDSKCSCSALEICRHVLRTVLSWQKKKASEIVTTTEAGEEDDSGNSTIQPQAWDPGSVTDSLLETQVPKHVRDRAELLWKQGVLAELLRSAKPSAHFHCPGHTVRFLVPDDVRYAQCSCSDATPCVHAVLAVRAFRCLNTEATSGIVSEGPLAKPVPAEPLVAAEVCAQQLITDGFSSLTTVWRDRARRAAADCDAASLIWPAQILEELADDFDRYAARDSAFSPERALERLGELLLRKDAIFAGGTTTAGSPTANTEELLHIPVPQAFVRGMKSDRDSDLGAARFMGLGGSIVQNRLSSTVTIFLQDADNGHAMTLTREFNEDPKSDPPGERRSFTQLARAPAVKDANLRALAAGQLITNGGRRTAAGRIILGRSRSVVNPQNFSWEQLKAPVLVEDFAELRARLKLLPPASFRPRRAASDFHVCPVAEIHNPSFEPFTNAIEAMIVDRSGNMARLSHPWSERGEKGAEILLAALKSGAKPLFIAGNVRIYGPELRFSPTAMIFGEGTARWAVFPWLDSTYPSPITTGSKSTESFLADIAENAKRTAKTAARSRYQLVTEILTEVLLNGVRRIRKQNWPDWQTTIQDMEERGYHRMASLLQSVQNQSSDPAVATMPLLKLLTLSRDVEGMTMEPA